MRMQKMQKMQCMGKDHTHFCATTTLMPPLGDALDASASMAQRGEAQRFGQQVARMLLGKEGGMPIRDLIDAHQAAFGLQRPVAVKVDFKAKSLLELLGCGAAWAGAIPGLTRRADSGACCRGGEA